MLGRSAQAALLNTQQLHQDSLQSPLIPSEIFIA